ncbi:predicted protein [Naegleria gruberi]|uniref:Predicted protein n=1 Tax=Naegleria gruberi TaxID=5762 RepID=D2VAX9_NAEGR|nr:uncharacterized protein NAEGRDRAFT_48071 [Naegleria gruberi]EFC46159.1 predicted protein [Naegleria gruberi]|eukprot:XP_002678903.1 predicted protein [Naegleria gruberi strain NEG-M]
MSSLKPSHANDSSNLNQIRNNPSLRKKNKTSIFSMYSTSTMKSSITRSSPQQQLALKFTSSSPTLDQQEKSFVHINNCGDHVSTQNRDEQQVDFQSITNQSSPFSDSPLTLPLGFLPLSSNVSSSSIEDLLNKHYTPITTSTLQSSNPFIPNISTQYSLPNGGTMENSEKSSSLSMEIKKMMHGNDLKTKKRKRICQFNEQNVEQICRNEKGYSSPDLNSSSKRTVK